MARGLQDDVQDNETGQNLNDGVIMLNDMDNISNLPSGTITWTNKYPYDRRC